MDKENLHVFKNIFAEERTEVDKQKSFRVEKNSTGS